MNETFSGNSNIQMNPFDSQRDSHFSNLEKLNKNYSYDDDNSLENLNNLENQDHLKSEKEKSNFKKNNDYLNLETSPPERGNRFCVSLDNNLFDKTLIFDLNKEEKLDTIILKKLDAKNYDLDFEFQELKKDNLNSNNINNISNPENSLRISERTERQFFEKITINKKIPYQEHYSRKYKIVKCENITTLKIDNKKISYLTNPQNKNDLYFIKFNNDFLKFKIEDFNIYNKDILKYTKIPFRILKIFIESINKPLLGLDYEIRRFKFVYKVKFLFSCFIFFLILFCLTVSFYYYGDEFTNFDNSTNNIINAVISFILSIILFCYIYNFNNNKMIDYHINKILLRRQEQLDSIIYKWNADYFIEKMNYLAIIPFTFRYVMIIMKPNKKIL